MLLPRREFLSFLAPHYFGSLMTASRNFLFMKLYLRNVVIFRKLFTRITKKRFSKALYYAVFHITVTELQTFDSLSKKSLL